MKRQLLPILILVSAFSMTTHGRQPSDLLGADEPPRQVDNPSTGSQILDLINQRRDQASSQEGNGQSQTEQNDAPVELRPSPLTQQGSGSLARPSEQLGPPTAAAPAETQMTTIPSGWFRRTAYAWSVGDNQLLTHQVATAFWKALPWGVLISAILLSAYLERRRREPKPKHPLA